MRPRTEVKPPAERAYVPPAPRPSAARPADGMDVARAEARRYLPNLVRLLASLALSPDSELPLHTRWLCANRLADIAGVIPQHLPATFIPLPEPLETLTETSSETSSEPPVNGNAA